MNDVRWLGRLLMGAAPGPDTDWQATIDLARRHGVSPFLYWRLCETRAASGEPEAGTSEEQSPGRVVMEALRPDYVQAAARTVIVEGQLGRVLAALADAGVPAVVLKGAAAAANYPDPALRAYGDLDLLVTEARLGEAEEALRRLGYHPLFDKEWGLAHHHHLPPMVSEGRLPVEIHWRLDHPTRPGRLPAGDLWSRAVSWSVSGRTALRLERVDAVLHACRHQAVQNRARGGLRAVCDLAQALNGWTSGDWDALVERAAAYGLRPAVQLMLVLMEQALGRAAPPRVLAALQMPGSAPLPDDLFERLSFGGGVAQSRVLAALARADAQPGGIARLRRLLAYVFPPRSRLAIHYGLPAASPRVWLARLVWPWDLARRHGRMVWAAWRGGRGAAGARERELWLERWLQQDRRPGPGAES